MPEEAPPYRRCRVLLPFAHGQRPQEVMDYQHQWVHDDLATWFSGKALVWDWVPVTGSNLGEVVAEIGRLGPPEETVVVNLCDGDDINGYPGLSVVTALERAGLAFTGAGSDFYALSTSKPAMKERMAAAGIPTAPWRVLTDLRADLERAATDIGFPLFVKPGISAAAAGISARSLVHDLDQALARVERLAKGMHGFHFAPDTLFVEAFLPGREFSVLVAADAGCAGGARAFAPCERVFPPGLRPEQRFVTFERNYGGEEEDTDPADKGYLYDYAPVEAELDPPLRRLGLDAFAALAGTGYGRVDIRLDGLGRPMVLEVNANCGLTAEGRTSTVGAILDYSGSGMGEMLDLMLRDAWRRRFAAPRRGVPS